MGGRALGCVGSSATEREKILPWKASAQVLLRGAFLDAPEIALLGVARTILAEKNLARANPGFVDRLIHAEYLSETAGMLSFEKAARKLVGSVIPDG